MKVEVIKCLSHSVELNFGEISVCINTDEAQNLIAQLRAVVPAPADIREAEIKKINITPSEVRYVIDAIHSYAGIFMTEDDAKKGLAIFKAGEQHEREWLMKEAVEGQVTAIDTARFLDIDQDICDKRVAECKDGDKVKLIILK